MILLEQRHILAALKNRREAKKLTQADIGATIGLSREAVSNLERRATGPSLNVYLDYCQAMGADPIAILIEARNLARKEDTHG